MAMMGEVIMKIMFDFNIHLKINKCNALLRTLNLTR